MMIPTIHMNGTSKQSLLDQVCDAGSAVMKAMEALGNAAPNGRDYYPQGPGAIKTAIEEHSARMAKLREVYNELEQLAMAISDID